jgi:hypothetical protein
MTTTEDRLSDALHAAARSVTVPGLRPLEDHATPGRLPADRRQPRRRWLAAVASAAAVALIASLAVAVSSHLHPAPAVPTGGLPRYYAEGDLRPVIRATATGRVTEVLPGDPGRRPGVFGTFTTADDRTFFVLFEAHGAGSRIYRFQVTPAGRVGRLVPVPGGDLGHEIATTMAISPDGSQLAMAVRPNGVTAAPTPDEVVVLSTRTGARTTWTGGPAPRGEDPRSLTVSQLSWTADGRELAYLAYWDCRSRNGEFCPDAGPVGAYEEVRTLNPARRGGSLTSGRLLLLAPHGYVLAAAISPDGAALTMLSVPRQAGLGRPARGLYIIRIAASGRKGRTSRVLYRLPTGQWHLAPAFVPGPSGRYLIVVTGTPPGGINGWVAHGRLHRLAPAGRYVFFETW